MKTATSVRTILIAINLTFLLAGMSFASDWDLKTPEGAVTAYLDGVKRRDSDAILAATAISNMSKGFDIVANVETLRTLTPHAPAPANDPFFVDVNEANFKSDIMKNIKFLVYGLMTKSEIVKGKQVPMDSMAAADFATVVRPDRLAGLSLLKIGIPRPSIQNNEKHQANIIRTARTFGADDLTDRVALISFEGLNFVIGFRLLRYGEHWGVMSQWSAIAGTSPLGTPERTTVEAFEKMLR